MVKDERPISERGLARIDLQTKADIQRIVVSAILHNPDVGEQSRFATACYKDLFIEKGARTSAKISTASIDEDMAQIAKQRQQNAYKNFPSTKYWVRTKVEGKTSTITSPKDPLTTFDTLIDMPPHESLRDFSDTNLVERKWKAGMLASRSVLLPTKQRQLLIRFGPLISGELSRYIVMEKRTGWGQQYSAEQRNGEWEYQSFRPDRTINTSENVARCMACHKSQAKNDYVFTAPRLLQR